jgi:hypothetical protein
VLYRGLRGRRSNLLLLVLCTSFYWIESLGEVKRAFRDEGREIGMGIYLPPNRAGAAPVHNRRLQCFSFLLTMGVRDRKEGSPLVICGKRCPCQDIRVRCRRTKTCRGLILSSTKPSGISAQQRGS